MTFLEFFEALIGCALVTYKNIDTDISSKSNAVITNDSIKKELTSETIMDSMSEKANNRSQLMSAQKSSQLETTFPSHLDSKKELKRGKRLIYKLNL
jgi:hypothetical protein